VREALQKAGRGDLIGSGCDCLIPSNPPREALMARMKEANRSLGDGKYVHTIESPKNMRRSNSEGQNRERPAAASGKSPQKTNKSINEGPAGYRPNRKSAGRRSRG